jgi:hypothetical protein
MVTVSLSFHLDHIADSPHNYSRMDSTKWFPLLRLALVALLVGAVFPPRGLADNPWSSTPQGWAADHGVPSEGWASWDSTVGGTFDSPSAPHHQNAPPSAPRVSARNAEIDPVMLKAASIAEHRALPHGTFQCWHYVKEALVAAGGVNSFPQTEYAKDAGRDLVAHYGFVKLPVRNAERAPVGAVLVYGGHGAGHVEMRTARGFTSDCICVRPAGLPFLGAYARVAPHRDTAQAAISATPGS